MLEEKVEDDVTRRGKILEDKKNKAEEEMNESGERKGEDEWTRMKEKRIS